MPHQQQCNASCVMHRCAPSRCKAQSVHGFLERTSCTSTACAKHAPDHIQAFTTPVQLAALCAKLSSGVQWQAHQERPIKVLATWQPDVHCGSSRDGSGIFHAEQISCDCILALLMGSPKKPSLTFWQRSNVQVLLQPISIFLASALRCSHRKMIRAQDVRPVVQPNIIGVLVAYRLAQCHNPGS